MTFGEIYDAFLAEIKHENTTSATPDEFNYHIWREELDYVKKRYFAHQQNQKSIDDLSFVNIETNGLVGMPQPLTNNGINQAGKEYFQMPEDLLILTSVLIIGQYKNVSCRKDGTKSKPIAARYLSDDRYGVVTNSYYSQESLEYPCCYYKVRNHAIIPQIGDSVAHELIISYLKYPKRIKVDEKGEGIEMSPFGESQTLEIIRNAAFSYLETIESIRPQTMAQVEATEFKQVPHPHPFYVNPQ